VFSKLNGLETYRRRTIMPETVNDAMTTLHKDIDTHHLDKFIQDLGQDLKTFTNEQDQAKLKQEAHDILVKAHIIPDLTITGVADNKIQLKDGDSQMFLDSSAKLRNEQGKIDSDANENVIYEYENGELVRVKENGNPKFEKKADGWYDENGKKFPKGHEPNLNQQTGDLTFRKADDDGDTTWLYKGGSVYRDSKGRVTGTSEDGTNVADRDFKYDKKGQLTEVDYKKGDWEDRWVKQDDGTWQNQKKNGDDYEDTDRTMKKIGVTSNGDYYEVADDGKKRTFHLDGTDETGDDQTTQKKGSTDWVNQRHKNQADIEKDIRDNDEHVVKYGDTLWDIAKQSAKVHSEKDPSNADIAAEMQRLIKKNKIDNANNVPIGTKIDTSEDT
jgi:LysM domain